MHQVFGPPSALADGAARSPGASAPTPRQKNSAAGPPAHADNRKKERSVFATDLHDGTAGQKRTPKVMVMKWRLSEVSKSPESYSNRPAASS